MNGFTIFSDNQGAGYIHEDPNEINTELVTESVSINGKKIVPGDYTTLNGHFSRPVIYIGYLLDGLQSSVEMIFKIGTGNNLFATKHYYQSIYRISDTRIFEMYSHISGRDFIFKGGKWR